MAYLGLVLLVADTGCSRSRPLGGRVQNRQSGWGTDEFGEDGAPSGTSPPPSGTPQSPSKPPVPSPGKLQSVQSLPPQILTPWQRAGAQIGWLRYSTHVHSVVFLPQDQGQAGDLPAFAFRGRPDTPLAKLPDPAMPFGLHFTRGQFDVTDVTLQELAQLPNLQGLNLENSQVTPNGLRALAGRNLRLLSLPKGLRSDEGLQHYIAALHPPTELRLSNWNITDAGLPALTPLTSLQSLNLGQTRITDAGLRTLTGL